MIALYEQVPFRRDTIQKVLDNQFRRDKGLNLELMVGLCDCWHEQPACKDCDYIY